MQVFRLIPRRAACSLVLVTAGLAAAAVGSLPGGALAAKGEAAQPARLYRIGYSQCRLGDPWREQMDKDVRGAAEKHPEIKLTMKDAQDDASAQQAHVKEFVAAKFDAIIISPKDKSLTAAIAEAYDAKIPVIVLDLPVDGEKYTCFISGDNQLIGKEVAKWIVKKLDGKGNIVELKGSASSVSSQERSQPLHEQAAGTKINIVYEADMQWLKDIAREQMQTALSRNPQKGSINLVYGADDSAALAAYDAAKAAGREGEMIFVGVNALPQEGIEAVKNGVLDATFEYPNGAALAIENVLKVIEGKEVPRTVKLGTRLYTKENVEKGGEAINANSGGK